MFDYIKFDEGTYRLLTCAFIMIVFWIVMRLKRKTTAIFNAVMAYILIGFLSSIIFYSLSQNQWYYFDSYDMYLLKHKKVDKFEKINIVNEIPLYKNISFDTEYLNAYINNTNNQIDNITYGENFKIDYQIFLNDLYAGCIKYILNNINKYR